MALVEGKVLWCLRPFEKLKRISEIEEVVNYKSEATLAFAGKQ